MGVSPIDLQTMYANMNNVARSVSHQQQGLVLAQQLQEANTPVSLDRPTPGTLYSCLAQRVPSGDCVPAPSTVLPRPRRLGPPPSVCHTSFCHTVHPVDSPRSGYPLVRWYTLGGSHFLAAVSDATSICVLRASVQSLRGRHSVTAAAAPLCPPSGNVWYFPFLTSTPQMNKQHPSIFITAITNVKLYFTVVWICFSLMTSDTERLFMCFLAI